MMTTTSIQSGDSKKKKIRVSRNKKKSWRKHTDIKEIEDFLENKRFEERVGYELELLLGLFYLFTNLLYLLELPLLKLKMRTSL